MHEFGMPSTHEFHLRASSDHNLNYNIHFYYCIAVSVLDWTVGVCKRSGRNRTIEEKHTVCYSAVLVIDTVRYPT